MAIYHLIVATNDADAIKMTRALNSLDVPDVFSVGTTVQVRVPGSVPERDHWRALVALADNIIPGAYVAGRAAEGDH